MDNLLFMEAKCGKCGQVFYLRYDLAADDRWTLTYGTKELPQNQSTGGFDKSDNIIFNSSHRRIGPQFKCPWCGNTRYVQCGVCKKLTCYDGRSQHAFCAHCQETRLVGGIIKDDDLMTHEKSIQSGQ